MKLAAALLVLAVAGLIAVFVVVYSGNRDPTPDALRTCVQDLGIPRVIGNDGLGLAKVDIPLGTVQARQRIALQGGTHATIFAPPDDRYTLLAVTRTELPADAVLRQVAGTPEDLVYVAVARSPSLSRAMAGCVRARAA